MIRAITPEDIKMTEDSLLGPGDTFDNERQAFIRDFTTLDLQAAPGSGKTTALMAKLLILAKQQLHYNEPGILVLSHTNTAVDEIKDKLGKICPNLFEHPNYVGTIQGFVDEFLAMPYYSLSTGKKIYRIDNDIYNEAIDRSLYYMTKDFLLRYNIPEAYHRETKRHLLSWIYAKQSRLYEYRFKIAVGPAVLLKDMNGPELVIIKPKGKAKNYHDFLPEEKIRVKNYLKAVKMKVLLDGVCCFDDAYYLANFYLTKYPKVKDLLQLRFKYVFVDEMQDMDRHQVEILEKIFYDADKLDRCYQRIGDINQSIYNGKIPTEDIWNKSGRSLLTIPDSRRFHSGIAEVVKPFGVEYLEINGNRNLKVCKPVLLIYNDQSMSKVVPYYPQLLKQQALENDIEIPQGAKMKAIAWRKESEENFPCLKTYYPQWDSKGKSIKYDFDNLISYISQNFATENGLKEIYKSVINGILKLCRTEEIEIDGGKYYTKSDLFEFISSCNLTKPFFADVYRWCRLVYIGEIAKAHKDMQVRLLIYLNELFSREEVSNATKNFLDSDEIQFPSVMNNEKIAISYNCPVTGFEIELNTVHGVKGETHFATMYLESKYEGDFETRRVIDQLLGKNFSDKRKYHKDTAKMMYVGLSRPKQFLVLACHHDNVKDNLDTLSKRWKIDTSLME